LAETSRLLTLGYDCGLAAVAGDPTSSGKLPSPSPVDGDLRTALERKERVRRTLLRIKTPEKRREAIRVALERLRAARAEAERAIRKAFAK
jgi:hypothetical protein